MSEYHTVIDKDHGAGWPTEKVEAMKHAHEAEIDRRLAPGERIARVSDEALVVQLATWESLIGIDVADEWTNLTFGLNQAVPRMSRARAERLLELGRWLLSRDWPADRPRLRIAFDRHLRAVQTLINVLNEVMTRSGERVELVRLDKGLSRWDPDEHDRLLRETYVRASTVWFLTVELARSTNLVISAARREVDPLYRMAEGLVLTKDGDGIVQDLIVRDEYAEWDWDDPPGFPTIAAVREAIVAAAGPDAFSVGDVDVRALRPVLPGAAE